MTAQPGVPTMRNDGLSDPPAMDDSVGQQILFIRHLAGEGQLELALEASRNLVDSLNRYRVGATELKAEAELMLAELMMLAGHSSLQQLSALSASADNADLSRTAVRLEFDLATAMLHEAEYSSLLSLVQNSSKGGANAEYFRRILCLLQGDPSEFLSSSDFNVDISASGSLALPVARVALAAESLRASQARGLLATSEEALSSLRAEADSAALPESCIAGVCSIAVTDYLVAQGRLAEAKLFLDTFEEIGKNASWSNQLAGSLSLANLALALKDHRTAENLILDLGDGTSGPRATWLRAKRILIVSAAGLGREQQALRIFRDFVKVAAGQRLPFPDTMADLLRTVVGTSHCSSNPLEAGKRLENLIVEIEPYLGAHSSAIIEAKLKAAVLLFEGGGLRQALKRFRLIEAFLRFSPTNEQRHLLREAAAYSLAASLMIGGDFDPGRAVALTQAPSPLEAANLADRLLGAGSFAAAREALEQTNPSTSSGLISDRLNLLCALANQGGRALDDEGLKTYLSAIAETTPAHYASLQTYLMKMADAFEAVDEFHSARGLFRSLLAHIPSDEASTLLWIERRMAGNLEAAGDHYDAAKHYNDLASRYADSRVLDHNGLFELSYREALNWCLNFSFERALPTLQSLRTKIASYTGTVPRENVLFWLARSLEHLRRPDEAADCYMELVALVAVVPSRSGADFQSRVAYSAGVNLEQCGRYEDAVRYYDIAHSGYAALLGGNHSATARAAVRRSFCIKALGLPTNVGTVDLMRATADSPA